MFSRMELFFFYVLEKVGKTPDRLMGLWLEKCVTKLSSYEYYKKILTQTLSGEKILKQLRVLGKRFKINTGVETHINYLLIIRRMVDTIFSRVFDETDTDQPSRYISN